MIMLRRGIRTSARSVINTTTTNKDWKPGWTGISMQIALEHRSGGRTESLVWDS